MIRTNIIFIFLLTWKCTLSVCRSFQGKTCCSGFVWNKDKSTCEKCPLGYQDINCTEMCKFPSYGEDCQLTCNCAVDLCDYKYGCRVSNGITSDATKTAVGHITTTSTIAESTACVNMILHQNTYNVLSYLSVGFLGLFFILCSFFVGTYLYKPCIKHVAISEQKGNCDPPTISLG